MDVLFSVVGLCLALFAGVWTYEDAKKRGMTAGSAVVWGLGVAVLLILFLPLYLAGRPPLPAAAPGTLQVASQLVQLEQLKARGTLSEEEFQQAKARLLSPADLSRTDVDEASGQINALLQQGRKPEALAAALQLREKLSGQAEYAGDLRNVETAIVALSGSPPAASGSRVLGGLLLALGGLMVLGAMSMDVSVAVPTQTYMGETFGGGRVNNIGLMNDRQNLVMLGSALGLGGLLLMLLGGKR